MRRVQATCHPGVLLSSIPISAVVLLVGCGSDADDASPSAGSGNASGTGATSGTGASGAMGGGGGAGASGGTAGTGGTGTGGTGGSGTGGSAGTGTGGAGGSSGTGTGGAGGSAGTGTGGMGGAAGTAGMGGSGGIAGTSGGGGSGGGIVVPPGDPFPGDPLTWTAVPVTDAICRDGSATGVGVNKNPDSTKLFIYMEGGGACFNTGTCAQNPSSWAATDSNLTSSVGSKFVLDRANTENPFKDWNIVYVPYCTGDVHTGSNMSGYMGQPMMGYANYFKYLQRMLGTWPNLTEVVLSGSSAGGFGAAWNWMLTQDAFGAVQMSVIDDSGPTMAPDYLSNCQQQRVAEYWGWATTVHPACTACDVAAGNVVIPLVETAVARHTATRFGLLSYDEDGTIKSFFGYGQDNCANWDSLLPPAFPMGKYPEGLADLRTRWAPFPHVAMYEVSGNSHTFLGGNLGAVVTGSNVTMLAWINLLTTRGNPWTNVFP